MKIKNNNKLFDKAFTLLELIVAVTLMNIIALTLYSSMYIAVKAKQSATAAVKPYRLIIPAFNSIQRDLGSVMAPGGLFAGAFQGYDAIGLNDSDTLNFSCCSYYPENSLKASNVVQVEYVIEQDQQTDDYILTKKTTTNPLSSKTVETEDEIVARGITFLDFKYYDGYSWVDSWDSATVENELPQAVEISISALEDNDGLKQDEKDSTTRDFKKIIYLAHLNSGNNEGTNED